MIPFKFMKHRSMYELDVESLLMKRKRVLDDSFIFRVNTLWVLVMATWFYSYEFQHLAIILYILCAVLIHMATYFDSIANDIDYIIYLKEKMIYDKQEAI